MTNYVCYCFKYTEQDIIEDLKNHGHSTILDRITEEKSKNACNCEEKHPEHRWCLVDVRRLVDSYDNREFYK